MKLSEAKLSKIQQSFVIFNEDVTLMSLEEILAQANVEIDQSLVEKHLQQLQLIREFAVPMNVEPK